MILISWYKKLILKMLVNHLWSSIVIKYKNISLNVTNIKFKNIFCIYFNKENTE